ncbi:MAG TPA: hypothetical protein DD740_12685 [Chryseobacterium sp.]|nr:hypothetical protein [Chryseobacterium sp.]
MNYRKIGDLIQLVDQRNKDLAISHLVGLTINKKFIPSVANTIGADMANYKLIRKNQFACSTMQVRRDKKMPIALLKELDIAIISQAYPVFEVLDENVILPDYLMLWFSRSEFDREACFHAVGGVRGSLEWEDFCRMQLPVPSIEEQRQIVAQYQSIANKIKVNEQICEKLEATAQALYKHWFVDNKSDDWEVKKIGEVSEIKAGGDRPTVYSEIETEKCFVPIFSNGVTNEGLYGFTDKAIYPEKSITISARGTIGYCVLRNKPFVGIVRLLVVTPFNKFESTYLFEFLKRIEFDNSGSVQNQLTIPQISTLEIIMPPEETLRKYDESVMKLNDLIEMKMQENKKLTQLQSLLLSRLAVGDEEKRKIMV